MSESFDLLAFQCPNFKSAIRKAMKDHGIPVSALARASGITRQGIYAMLGKNADHNKITVGTLRALSMGFQKIISEKSVKTP